MLKIKEKAKKVFSAIGIFSLLFVELFPLGVSAASFTIPDSLMNSVTNATSTTSSPTNSASNDPSGLSNKQQGPKVEVTFNSSGGAKPGSKMTATAVPSFFNNASDPKKLYFTWYLKRSGCGLTKSDDPGDVDKCDMDGDGKITENDWKIAAAKIIIDGSFDRSEADYAKFPTGIDENSAGYKATPSPVGEWSINSGADENGKDAPNCYVQSPKSGLVYELRRTIPVFDDDDNKACPSGYHRACVTDQTAKCDVLNPAYTQAAIDASNASQAAIDAANAWNSDPANVNDQHVVPAFVPIPPKTIPNDFGACAVSSEKKDNSDVTCSIKDDKDLKNYKAVISCNDSNATPLCVKDTGNTEFMDTSVAVTPPATQPILGVIFPNALFDASLIPKPDQNTNGVCGELAKPNDKTGIFMKPPNFLDNTQPAISAADEKCTVVKDKLTNGTKDANGNIAVVGNPDLNPVCSFKKDVNLCKHLFPKVPGEVTGDGSFTLAEKKFWGADPTKASTSGTGKDEENAVGLGVDKFTWMFSPGDQVGVVVEGDSAFPTGHADSSYKRMWAFSKDTCSVLKGMESRTSIANKDHPENNTRGFYIEGTGSSKTGFLTADLDLDECLKENLLDPDVDGTSKLTVQLNASPENPINDPSGRGDILNIASGATNTQNPSGLLYKWSVQESRDGSAAPIDTTSWVDITSAMESNGSFSASDVQGLGKKDLAINLNMPESLVRAGIINPDSSYSGVFYLKVKVKITGTAADGSQNAQGEVTVRVKQQQNEIHVYPVSATNSGMLSLNKGLTGQSLELCSDQQGKTRCYVTKNEILGLEVPDAGNNKLSNFSWKVNGNAISCSANISSQCVPGGNKLFVPVLGNVGEAVDVVATAVNEKNESIEVSRHFVIGESQLQITSLDPNSFCGLQCLDSSSACPKYLGHYNGLGLDSNGNRLQYPDCSAQVWETREGNTVTLGATGQAGFDWAIDGQIMPEYKDQNQIQLVINKAAGESYNIGLSTHLLPGSTNQLNNIRLALYKNWGVAPEEAVEENQSANIQLNVVDGPGQTMAAATPASFGASLITHLPEQLMFLLKISLTSMLLLLVTGLLFAFIPETLFKEEER